MGVRLMNDPLHECGLPDPLDYPEGQRVQCTDERVVDGKREECGMEYTRTTVRRPWKREIKWVRTVHFWG